MNNTLHKLSFSYIFNFKKDKAFSVSTILSSLALILGISILITVMSVMNGFREQLVESLSGVNGDITIYDANKDKIKKIQEKNPSISFVENLQSRVITSNENGIEGLLMKSLNKEDIYKIPKINQNIFEIEINIDNWVFIGVELARSLNLKVGMPIQINIPGNSMTILGPVLNSKQLTPGMEVHANAIQTILDNNYISIYGGNLHLTKKSFWHHFVLILGLAIIAMLFFLINYLC